MMVQDPSKEENRDDVASMKCHWLVDKESNLMSWMTAVPLPATEQKHGNTVVS